MIINEKAYFTNDKIKEILGDTELTEENKRKLLIEIRDKNQQHFLEAIKRNKELKNCQTTQLDEVEEKQTENTINIPKESKKMKDISFYLNQIKECKTIEEIIQVLPKNNNYDFELLINTILTYYIGECVEIEKILASEDLLEEDRKEFFEELHETRDIINAIVVYRNQGKENTSEIEKNKLVYLSSSSGNIYALNDLKAIDVEYYDSFLELIQSIIDGTFKNVKAFLNNDKMGQIYEVKNFKTRVVFDRLDKNTYVILNIFMKKTDKDSKYRDQIVNRASRYYFKKEDLKKICKNESFLEENQEITNELLNILQKKGETRK